MWDCCKYDHAGSGSPNVDMETHSLYGSPILGSHVHHVLTCILVGAIVITTIFPKTSVEIQSVHTEFNCRNDGQALFYNDNQHDPHHHNTN